MEELGFSGTRKGMSKEQLDTVNELTVANFSIVHIGDCVGADVDMYNIAKRNNQLTHGHPPIDPKLRAYCDFDFIEEPKAYHVRNRDIVNACDLLIATPFEMSRQKKGGTWMTVNYAIEVGKPYVIVWPDGTYLDLNV